MIYRIQKDKNNPYVQINKRGINDSNLSFKAKGILAYLLSKPDDWIVRLEDITKHSNEGIKSVRAGMKELITAGYIQRSQDRGQAGEFREVAYTVYETSTITAFQPLFPFRQAEERQADNGTLLKNDITNNDITNNDNVVMQSPQNGDCLLKDSIAYKSENPGEDYISLEAALKNYTGEYIEAIERLIYVFFDLHQQYTGHTHCVYTAENWNKVFYKLDLMLESNGHRLNVPYGLPDALYDLTEDNIVLLMNKYFEDGLHKQSDGRILHFLCDHILAIRLVRYCYY